LQTREDIDENYEIGTPIPREVKQEEEIKIEEKDQMTQIRETFDKLIAEKKNVREIISTLSSHGYNPILVDDIVTSYIEVL
jgi:actin-like ATPase involved in cell morphogenesis